MGGRVVLLARFSWLFVLAAMPALPLGLCELMTVNGPHGMLQEAAVDSGLVAFALLVVAVLLIGRIPSLLSAFGIERVLRMHRLVALAAVVLVAGHVALVLVTDPRGLAIFDLVHTTPAARAATISTLALAAIVVLGVRRRRRQPRYEGWRMLHLVLFGVVLLGAWLHIWWLKHLEVNALFAGWLVLMALLVLGVVLRRWLWVPMRARRRPYVVEDVASVSADTVTVAVSAYRHRGIHFRPGQFAYLKIGKSPFVFEEHPFSIASTATSPRRMEFTVKALGDFSELLRGMRPGRQIYVDGAYGGLTTDGLDRSSGFVFIAGGIGVTPMLSMLRTLADRGDRRRHLLVMGARSKDDLGLRQDVDELRERLDLTVVDVLADPPRGWTGERGRIDRALLDRRLPQRGRRHVDYFLCGPPQMVLAVERHLRRLAISPRRIHTERFEIV